MLGDSPTMSSGVAPGVNTPLSPVLDSSEDSLERAVLGIAAKLAPLPPALSLEDVGCDPTADNSLQEKPEVCQPKKGPPPRGRTFVPAANGKKTKAIERPKSPSVGEKENRNSGKPKVFSRPSSGDGSVGRKVSSVSSNATKPTSKLATKVTKTPSAVSKEKTVAKPSVPAGGPRRVPIHSADAPAIGKVRKG